MDPPNNKHNFVYVGINIDSSERSGIWNKSKRAKTVKWYEGVWIYLYTCFVWCMQADHITLVYNIEYCVFCC